MQTSFPTITVLICLKKDSYVDNRIKTGNSIDVLLDLFTRDNKRMEKKR